MVTRFVKFTLLVLGNCLLSAAAAFADTTYTLTLESPLTCAIGCAGLTGEMWSVLPGKDTLTIDSGIFASTGADILISFTTPATIYGNLFTGVPALSNDAIGMGWINGAAKNLSLVDPLLATEGHFEPIQVASLNATTGAVATQFDGMYTLTSQTVTVPEPGSAGLLLIGLAALAGAGTLRKKLIA
jgi:hypothetical protein